ncbi:MAG: hypothetical protein A2V75_09390 [Actinobacteria bacterium RBG_16_70_17]|nr:MAG: hypothetical protein A2V75_09390 [Actinobacteria bacterium RBG_16_70_17]
MAAVVVLMLAVAGVSSAATQTYPNRTLSGGYQAGHFNDVWDLTAGDMTLSFTYNANGLSDAAGGHAWAELGVRSLAWGGDFNPGGSGTVYTYPTITVALLAGQSMDVGDVIVTNDGTNVYVTYTLDSGWCMTESHLAVSTSLSGIPQTKTHNPIPGQFAYGNYHDPCATSDTFTIPLVDIGAFPSSTLYIAAHAKVSELATGGLCSAPGMTAYGPLDHYEGVAGAWGTAGSAVATWVHPSWPSLAGAAWISTAGLVENPDPDSWRRFSGSFEVPGIPLTGGATVATSDNAEEFYVNGALVGSDGEVQGPFADNQEWNTLLTYPFTPVTGANTYDFIVRNYSWPGGVYANPTGLLFCLDYSYLTGRTETAWGDGTRFTSKGNWAMYITYEPTATSVNGSGVWLATDYDWTPGTFGPDPVGFPSLDLDDKLILQRQGGQGEGAYNLPGVPPAPGNNHRIWWDRDGVDPWQNPATANTGGIYQVVITLHATGATTGTAYMNIRGLDQGFEVDGNWNTIELTPAGMTFTGDMEHLVVFYGLYGYGATHSVTFSGITVTQ